MNFTQFISDRIFSQAIIKEGGNAFDNVIPILKEDILQTVNNFINQILVPTYHIYPESNEIFMLGSTGKKDKSGDIDLGLNINFIKDKQNNIIKRLYTYTKINTDVNVILNSYSDQMIQFAYPIANKKNSYVQIDLLLTKYPVFTKWYMHSPTAQQSKYKAAHRNDLLRAIPKTLTFKSIKQKQGKSVLWSQQDINPNGTYLTTQTIIDENQNYLTYKDTNQRLLPEYAKIIQAKQLNHSPLQTINRYLGNYNPNNIDSFQQVYNIINSKDFKYTSQKQDILYTAAKMFKSNDKLEFPTQLEDWI